LKLQTGICYLDCFNVFSYWFVVQIVLPFALYYSFNDLPIAANELKVSLPG